MEKSKNHLIIGMIVLCLCTTQILAESKENSLAACEKKYKELQDEYWAYEQSTRVEIYDYIETNVDYDNYVKALKECTVKHDSVKAIRTCIKVVEEEFPF